jgi:hypothetical protein
MLDFPDDEVPTAAPVAPTAAIAPIAVTWPPPTTAPSTALSRSIAPPRSYSIPSLSYLSGQGSQSDAVEPTIYTHSLLSGTMIGDSSATLPVPTQKRSKLDVESKQVPKRPRTDERYNDLYLTDGRGMRIFLVKLTKLCSKLSSLKTTRVVSNSF